MSKQTANGERRTANGKNALRRNDERLDLIESFAFAVRRLPFFWNAERVLAAVLIIDLIAVMAALFMGGFPEELFDEGQIMTFYSAAQLLIVFYMTRKVFFERSEGRLDLKDWKKPFFVWYLVSMGFLYLTLDEVLLLHESFDDLIHWFFGMKETALSDRIDDIIVILYAVAGLAVLYRYRVEIKRYKKAFPLLAFGFLFFFVSAAFDILTNQEDVIVGYFNFSQTLFLRLNGTEEGFKIMAEGVFIGLFYKCREIAKSIKTEKAQREDL